MPHTHLQPVCSSSSSSSSSPSLILLLLLLLLLLDRQTERQTDRQMLTCPRCKHARNVCRITLYWQQKWRSILCTSCKRGISASKWLCPCDKRWHLCEVHRSDGFNCKGMYRNGVRPSVNTQLEEYRAHKRAKNIEPLGSSSCINTQIKLRNPTIKRKELHQPSSVSSSINHSMARDYASTSKYMRLHAVVSREGGTGCATSSTPSTRDAVSLLSKTACTNAFT